MRKREGCVLSLLLLLFLNQCSLAPRYQRPSLPIPTAYKESNITWKNSAKKPYFINLSWWKMYGDPILNQLESQLCFNNQSLKAALARLEEARALAGVARAAFFPTINGIGNINRVHTSETIANSPRLIPSSGLIPSLSNQHRVAPFNDNLLTSVLNYEVDIWGKVRDQVANANFLAAASASDLAALRLSLEAELAGTYFQLRGADAAQEALDKMVIAYRRSYNLTLNRFKGGASSSLDVDEALTQLEATKTLAADMHLIRAKYEHAIAVLVGKAPSCFNLKPKYPSLLHSVNIYPALPATLLERRPDIAAAEQRVFAANARIGVSRAAFFPDINFGAALGFESAKLSTLFETPSLIWALGPSALALFNRITMPVITQTIFDGGRLIYLNKAAWAEYSEVIANYRQTVLTAFQEVEDNLVALRQLDREKKTQAWAFQAAQRAVQQALYQYKGGLTTYLNVSVVQTMALQNQLNLIDVSTRRHLASVQLIKALGGGWPCQKQPLMQT